MRQVLKRVANTFQRIEGRDIYEPGFGKNFSHLAFRETALSSLKTAEMKAVAILLSHREAIRTALSNGDEMALVFEDDVSMELAPMWIDTIELTHLLLHCPHSGWQRSLDTHASRRGWRMH